MRLGPSGAMEKVECYRIQVAWFKALGWRENH
jgi:hypothetical protein